MNNATLREDMRQFLRYDPTDEIINYQVIETTQDNGYIRQRIAYDTHYGDTISAFLLIPDSAENAPAVLVQHQHHGQRHLGKSEVVGLAGDPLQNFGGVLAQRGFIVLAPDSICFEDRRYHATGIEPHEQDGQQHFNEMCYRLIQGDTLMHRILHDASIALALLKQHPLVDNARIGALGHSYGGNTVLFHTALDEEIRWACSSGAVCSYVHKLAHNISLEMALAIPGFAVQWDFHHLVQCIAPRPFLVVSADEDNFSQDADAVLEKAAKAYAGYDTLAHHRYQGGHALTQERFDNIIEWIVSVAASN